MSKIRYVKGDATEPIGDHKKLILHIVNDAGQWGRGFVVALSQKWPDPEAVYRKMHEEQRHESRLGMCSWARVTDDITVVNMVAQHDTRARMSPYTVVALDGKENTYQRPPVRYSALGRCLRTVRMAVSDRQGQISVHAPMFGAGLAGGDWNVVENLICEELIDYDVDVTIYVL